MDKIRVLLVDDHTMFRAGLRMLLENRDDIQVVGEAADGKEAIEKTRKLKPDVVLLDIGMAGMNGLEAARQIRERSPKSRILALTMHDNEEYFFEMLKAGGAGYILKEASPSELLLAIRSVHEGGSFLHPTVAKMLVGDYLERVSAGEESTSYNGLTEREKQVLKLIADGRTSSEIADILCISVNTVQTHRDHIYKKLKLHNPVELTKYAIRKGLVHADS